MTKTTNEPTEIADQIIKDLDHIARSYNIFEYGLPHDDQETTKLMREAVASRLSTLEAAVEERGGMIKKLRKALDRMLIDWNDGVVPEVYRGKPGAFASATYRIAQARAVLAETAPKVQLEEANNGNAK